MLQGSAGASHNLSASRIVTASLHSRGILSDISNMSQMAS